MSAVLEMLTQSLGGNAVSQLSRQLGADEEKTERAMSAALPVLLSALAKNASQGDGAQSLLGALDRDHDGSVLDDVMGFFARPDDKTGNGILGHVLGDRRAAVEQGVSGASGLDPGTVTKMMTMLAPLVMGALGRTQKQRGLAPKDFSDFLSSERTTVERANPALGGLTKMLDADQDGQIGDDLAKMGKSLLGSLFTRR